MNCLLLILQTCIFDPSNLTVTGFTAWDVSRSLEHRCHGVECRGPQAYFSVEMTVDVSERLSLRYGLMHRSYLYSHDRGEELATLSLQWRPFGSGR